jgi:hypothetical protein
MRLLLFVMALIGCLVSLLPILYPGTIVGALGTPVNVFVAETLRNTFNVRNETLVIMGEGSGHILTIPGVLAVYLPLLGLTLLALRSR